MQSSPGRPKGYCALISLGCPKNLVDSEQMLGLLQLEGYRWVAEPEGADFVVINTCGFLESARREAHEVIAEMVGLKRQGKLGGVIVAGCLAQRDGENLIEAFPEVDRVVGVFARGEIASVAGGLLEGETRPRAVLTEAPERAMADDHRSRITLPHLAYLKIAEGCDRVCSFCTIPAIRGKFTSKPLEQIVAEARRLAEEGVRELILIAQDTTYYGLDLYGRPRLADLLRALDDVDGLAWIRVMYLYPMHLTDELIEMVATGSKILPYLDLPLQHINDEVLRRMGRRVGRAQTEELLDRLRERIEGVVLRTTLIAGFPGETEEQFEELLDFVRRRRFERLGAFAYSREPDTPSDALDGHLPERLKQDRRDRLLAAQQEIAFAWNESQVGRSREVLVDSSIEGEKNAYVGRTSADAPEIDGIIYITGKNLRPGQIVPCEIVASQEYDLIGVATGRPRS